MRKESDYSLKDNECKTALKLLFENQTVGVWLMNHHSLYQSVVIAPEGLPPIVNAYMDDVFYPFISSFGHIYQTLLECQSELK